MARGHWRNWDEVKCEGCKNPIYQKPGKKHKGKLYCQLCYERFKKAGRGWHGDTPGHRKAALKAQASSAMNTPMVRGAKITNIPISEIDLRFNEDVPSWATVNSLMESIRKKEAIPPILISPNKHLEDGRHRLRAYKNLGYTKVPAIIGYNVGVSGITISGKPIELEVKEYEGQKYKTPKKGGDITEKFKQDLSRFLSKISRQNQNDTSVPEFKRWVAEDLIPFDQKEPEEQIDEKIYYEKDIGNDSVVFHSIEKFLKSWLKANTAKPDENIWYHGTTEEKYRKIMADGEIKVSTSESAQHKDFTHDIGTISLAKHKGMAHMFSALSGLGKQNQIILHIDTRKLDPSAIEKRALFAQEAEIIYHKNIPASAIVRAETVYVAKKQGEK